MFTRSLAAGLLVLAPGLVAAQSLPESYEQCRAAETPKAGIAACKKALQSEGLLQAERARTFVTLSDYQRQLGDYPAALASLDQAAKIGPNAPVIPAERAIVLQMSGDLAGAMKAHERAFALGGKSTATLNNRGVTELALGQAEKAIADFDAALELMADNGKVLENRALAKCQAGDADGAAADLLAAIGLDDADVDGIEAGMAGAGIEGGLGGAAPEQAEALERWTAAGCPGAPAPKFL